ncbi:MAG: WD40 repeat domain-containing protein, partial [Acidobacteria bacterium]|nr:WD40 repeat domain-containing protein [Acidobacteriota bacterium]
MAFAVAQLWERRDRERGLLTRGAYEEIGGVGGALAQHAEATMERIGVDRAPVVRELLRNLVTAQSTRATREREELLSVFPPGDRETVEGILDALVDARLLTAYETEGAKSSSHQIEIAHESLLTEWPRLVRWRTQDEEGARLRDELRQAARMWDEHGRAPDFLWSGTALREYEVWRERYPGGLSALEEEFARAMTAHAHRRSSRRRLAAAAVVAVAVIVAIAMGALWRASVAGARRAEAEAARATTEANRATAAKLLALGQAALERDRSDALAYAIESLRLADTQEARRFAVEVLWSGPPAMVTPPDLDRPWWQRFSPDGAWLAVSDWSGNVGVYPADGGPRIALDAFEGDTIAGMAFSVDGSLLMAGCGADSELRVWSVPDWSRFRSIALTEGRVFAGAFARDASEVIAFERARGRLGRDGDEVGVRRAPAGAAPALAGTIVSHTLPAVDPSGSMIAFGHGREVWMQHLDSLDAPPVLLGTHPDAFIQNGYPAFDPKRRFVAAADQGGNVVLWSVDPPGKALRRFAGVSPNDTEVSPDGALLCIASMDAHIWELEGVTAA